MAVPALVIAPLIGGCGSSDNPPAPTAPPAVTGTSVPRTETQPAAGTPPHQPARARKPSRHRSRRREARRTSSHTSGSHAKLAPGTWSGTGTAHLGTIIVERQSILTLSATGDRAIALSDASHAIDVSGSGKGVQTVVPPGTYRSVTITARGRWTIRIKTLHR